MTVEIDIHVYLICICLLDGEFILKHVWTRGFKVNADCVIKENDDHITMVVKFRKFDIKKKSIWHSM